MRLCYTAALLYYGIGIDTAKLVMVICLSFAGLLFSAVISKTMGIRFEQINLVAIRCRTAEYGRVLLVVG